MIVRIVVIGTGVRCLISAGILLGLSVRLCFHSLTSHTFPNFDSMDPSSSPLRQNDVASFDRQTSSRIYLHSSSSDDDVSPSHSIQSTNRRLDYMLQFLDRKLSSDHAHRRHSSGSRAAPLPEFVAKGGGAGIFRLPARGAVHPARPPSLELRPHPLRETQIGRFLRNIVSTESQLWAASECGVRFWNFKDLYASWCGVGEEEGVVARNGDEESAPFRESVWTSPTLCLVADEGNRLVWSGHKDGKIRCWKMDDDDDNNDNCDWSNRFTKSLSWHAHRGPVLSLTFTSYGHSSLFTVNFTALLLLDLGFI